MRGARETTVKVLLIDDHPLILAALQTVIRGLGPTVEVVPAESAQQAREMLQACSDYDLVLLDLQLTDAHGLDLLAEVREHYPAVPVVVVSASDRASDVIRSIDAGAMGYVPKRASNEMLFEALHLVLSGGIYVPPMTASLGQDDAPGIPTLAQGPAGSMGPVSAQSMTAAVEVDLHAIGSGVSVLAPATGVPRGNSYEALGLTPRQYQVLELLLQGKANKVIARELGLSVETIKDHVAAVLRSLGVSSRIQAVVAVGQLQKGAARAARG